MAVSRSVFTAEQIQSMSMKEYSKYRSMHSINGWVIAEGYSYEYWKDLWIKTGQLEFLEEMLEAIDD